MNPRKLLNETNRLRLQAFKKAQRETTHAFRPMKTTDKRKEASRKACRIFKHSC